jgi:pyrroloquinoline quinone biosynthesis protein B
LPQWNCGCRNCQAARAGIIPPQTQSSVAISADGQRWFLVNASPDIRAQLEAFPALQPAQSSTRNSPLESVLLTNADLDHTLGLLCLREGGPLTIHASESVRSFLSEKLAFTSILEAFCGVRWKAPPSADWAALAWANGSPSGLAYRAIILRSPAPAYGPKDAGEDETTAFFFRDERTGGTLLVAPDVFEIDAELAEALAGADAILFDGTFWSEDELAGVKTSARRASAMGHLPIRDGSLEILARSSARRRAYVHLNNTNPVLFPDSLERRAVEKAGIAIGRDGMEFEL